MSYKVYKIETIPSQLNTHTTGRMDTWTLTRDVEFDNLDDAKKYVISKNLYTTILPTLIVDMPSEQKEEFKNKFCFGEDHLDLCRYFLGCPDRKKIKSCLEAKGVKVTNL